MFCSVVCMTPTGKILVAKSNENAVIPGFWSCGIFRVDSDKMIEEAAKQYYMKEFNADIDIINQPNGEIKRAIPISIFTLDIGGPNRNIYENGIYLAAILRNPNQLVLDREYSEVKVLDLVGLATDIANVGIVPDLYFNIMTVLETFGPNGLGPAAESDNNIKNPTDELNIDESTNTLVEENKDSTVENETLIMTGDTHIEAADEEKAE